MRSDDQQQDRFYGLLEPELPRLQAFCHRLTGNPEAGEDLMQDALYDAWRGFAKLRQTEAFRGWLYQIIVNRYRTNLRKFRKLMFSAMTDDVVDESQARTRLACERLRVATSALSARDRALVMFHEIEGWSYPELAAMFKCSEGSLRTKLTRCRLRMREALEMELRRTNEESSKTGVFKRWIVVKQERS